MNFTLNIYGNTPFHDTSANVDLPLGYNGSAQGISVSFHQWSLLRLSLRGDLQTAGTGLRPLPYLSLPPVLPWPGAAKRLHHRDA